MTRTLTLLAGLGLLAGCGSVTRLRPQEGTGHVPKAASADRRETAAELMTPSTQAQPDRQADLLAKSVERRDDAFALPPGPHNGRVPPQPNEAATTVPVPKNTARDKAGSRQGLPDTIDADDDTPDNAAAPDAGDSTP